MGMSLKFLGTDFVFLLTLSFIYKVCGDNVTIVITHWNDVNGQLESYKAESTKQPSLIPCSTTVNRTECIGGLVYTTHWIHDDSSYTDQGIDENNVYRLSSGNHIGGESGWVHFLKDNGWNQFGRLINEYFMPHVSALGIKEFEAGVDRTIEYMNSTVTAETPWTLANVCEQKMTGEEETLCNLLPKLKVLDITIDGNSSAYKIGVIGFINPNVERLSLSGSLKFSPIISSIKEQVKDAKENQNIKTFIALGDGDLKIAKEILDEVSEVKIVIYGVGFDADTGVLEKYPILYSNRYIATAGKYGATIGRLILELDTTDGNIKLTSGNRIAVAYPSIKLNRKGQEALNNFTYMEGDINEARTSIVGQTRVPLDGGKLCWQNECNLGNLVADSMVHCALKQATVLYEFPLHSIWHGGALFGGSIPARESISKFDIHKWFPYRNKAHLVRVTGKNLRKVFETSATGIDPKRAETNDWGQFLQVSNGIEVHYDNMGPKPILSKVRIVHDLEGVPRLGDLEDERHYYLVIPTFLFEARGEYGFAKGIWVTAIAPAINNVTFGFDADCLQSYVETFYFPAVGFEERIWISGDTQHVGCDTCKRSNTAITITLTIAFFTIFLAIVYVGYVYILPRFRRPCPRNLHRNQD